MSDFHTFEIPGFATQSGYTLDVKLAYKTFGKLAPGADNVVVVPTFYGGRHSETEFMLASGHSPRPRTRGLMLTLHDCAAAAR